MSAEIALIIAIAALVLSVATPLITAIASLRAAEKVRVETMKREQQARIEAKEDALVLFWRRSLVALIESRKDAARAASQIQRTEAVNMELAGAFSSARGILMSIGDHSSHVDAMMIGGDEAQSFLAIDRGMEHLGKLINAGLGGE
jgi:hypothetical protein